MFAWNSFALPRDFFASYANLLNLQSLNLEKGLNTSQTFFRIVLLLLIFIVVVVVKLEIDLQDLIPQEVSSQAPLIVARG